jgi:hypothetical protein
MGAGEHGGVNEHRLTQRYKPKLVAALAILLMSSYSRAASADEYKEATEQAYCVGVHQAGIVVIKKRFGESQSTRDSELKKFRAQAYVDGAIRQHIIDAATASRMMQAGYVDSELCNETLFQCAEEAGARSNRNVDPDRNERLHNACESQANSACDRAYRNCQ